MRQIVCSNASASIQQEIAVTFLVLVSEHHLVWPLSPRLVLLAGSESRSTEQGHLWGKIRKLNAHTRNEY